MTIRSIDLPHDLAAVAALEDHYRTGYVHPPHAHDRAQLSFALSGVLTVNTAETSFVLPPNRAIWIPPYKLHQTICRSEAVFQLLYVDPRFIRQSRDCCVFETSPLVPCGDSIVSVNELSSLPRCQRAERIPAGVGTSP